MATVNNLQFNTARVAIIFHGKLTRKVVVEH